MQRDGMSQAGDVAVIRNRLCRGCGLYGYPGGRGEGDSVTCLEAAADTLSGSFRQKPHLEVHFKRVERFTQIIQFASVTLPSFLSCKMELPMLS